MAGALLRSGSMSEFYPLGAVGKPVYTAALQLRAAIRRRTDEATANLFAIPKLNEQGDVIDWYAPMPGPVVPWSAATAEERLQAKTDLEAARKKLAELSASLLAEEQSDRNTDRQVFGKLLEQATAIPGDEHIYLVNDRPVITFWGFHPLDAPPGYDVIGSLDAGGPAMPEVAGSVETKAAPLPPPLPAAGADGEPRRRRWWWWLLPLLLLLLLLLLLMGLKSCGVTVPFAPWLPSLPLLGEGPAPALDLPGYRPLVDDAGKAVVDAAGRPVWVDTEGRRVVIGDDGRPLPAALDGSAPMAIPAADGAPPAGVTEPGGEGVVPPASGEPGAGTAPADAAKPLDPSTAAEPPASAKPPAVPEATGVPAPGTTPEAGRPDAALPPGAPLTIPERSVASGDTSFLNGGWRSDTGLQDSSGNPIQLGYQFKGGEGAVTMQRTVGDQRQSCTGPARPAMEDGRLVITQGDIRCPDGTTFKAPRVVCKVGDGGRADCEGVNEDGSRFPVGITR